jgi:phytoene dehydrogenase-like protein
MSAPGVDVVVIGAGHNGLVAAILLAREGLKVRVLEDMGVTGGATRSDRPFLSAPALGVSCGGRTLAFAHSELTKKLGIEIPLRPCDPHDFLPTRDRRYLMLGTDLATTKHHFLESFSEADWRAHEAMQAELDSLRADLAGAWLEEPLSIVETSDRFVRPALREVFVGLCRGSVGDYLARFDFKSALVRAMYAVVGATGLYGAWNTPGTGMSFLLHNMLRLPGPEGTWTIVDGGMGTVAQRLNEVARRLGVMIETERAVAQIVVEGNVAKGVVLKDGTEIRASTIVCNLDPFRMRDMVGADQLPVEYSQRLDAYTTKPGATFRLNLALKGLPKFACCTDDKRVYGPTIHLLPDEGDVMQNLLDSFADASAGRLPEQPPIEWYLHTTLDPTLRDDAGNHSSVLFAQPVPYDIDWNAEADAYTRRLLSICDRFAPGTGDLVVEYQAMHPKRIEADLGMPRGRLDHVDNGWGFADRLPYATPVVGLYACSADCHPGGSLVGAAGHNAAMRVIEDLEAGLEETHVQPK